MRGAAGGNQDGRQLNPNGPEQGSPCPLKGLLLLYVDWILSPSVDCPRLSTEFSFREVTSLKETQTCLVPAAVYLRALHSRGSRLPFLALTPTPTA